jgi:hypothetical protein
MAAGVSHDVHVADSWRSRIAATALDGTLVLRIGLAVLFLVNALIAWVDPEQFTSLIGKAGVERFLSAEVILWGIRANDLAIAVALLFAWNRWPRLVPAWVGLYVFGVGVIKLAALV